MKRLNYYYTKKGLQVFLYNCKTDNQKARLIATPEFIELLNIITDKSNPNNFDYDLWDKLTQEEKNFLYKIDQLCIPDNEKNLKLEMAHLKESKDLITRLKLLEGMISAGNIGDNVASETIDIIKELNNRNQISGLVSSKMINKIKSLRTEQKKFEKKQKKQINNLNLNLDENN